MKFKRFTIVTFALALMALLAGAVVSAQGPRHAPDGFGRGFGYGLDADNSIILEATGLTADELRTALQDGSTIAELIEANDGDVESVIADLVAAATANIEAKTDEALANVEDRITNRVNNRGKSGYFDDRFNVNEIILEATGLTADELRTVLQDGSTIADLIESNDGDVESVIADLVAAATANLNDQVEAGHLTQAQADTRINNLETRITDRLNGTYNHPGGFDHFDGRRGRPGRPERPDSGSGFGQDNTNENDT